MTARIIKGLVGCFGVAVWVGLIVPVLIEYMPLPFTVVVALGVPLIFVTAVTAPHTSSAFSRWRESAHRTIASAEPVETPPQENTAETAGTLTSPEMTEPLSKRESEVLGLISAGRTNKEIARTLFVEVGTVKTHTNNINRKLGSRHRAEAIAKARDLGLL